MTTNQREHQADAVAVNLGDARSELTSEIELDAMKKVGQLLFGGATAT